MSQHISRHHLARFVVERLVSGDPTVLRQLAAYIVDERLTRQLDLIIDEIEHEFAVRGNVVADVASAYALDDASRRELIKFIASATDAKTVELRETTDAELIGGVVIETPGKYFDGSLSSQLNQLKMNSQI